jgi:hypothetical protein
MADSDEAESSEEDESDWRAAVDAATEAKIEADFASRLASLYADYDAASDQVRALKAAALAAVTQRVAAATARSARLREEQAAWAVDPLTVPRDLWRGVEVRHLLMSERGRDDVAVAVLASVAIVDADMRVRFSTLVREPPTGLVLSDAGAPTLSLDDLDAAPELESVLEAVAAQLRGCLLVAHCAELPIMLLRLSCADLAGVCDVSLIEPEWDLEETARSVGAPTRGLRAAWPAARGAAISCLYAQLLLHMGPQAANYLMQVRRHCAAGMEPEGGEPCVGAWFNFGQLGSACAMPASLRATHTYRAFFERHAFGGLQLCGRTGAAVRATPLPWHVPPTRVETAAQAAARLAAAAAAYETQLCAYLAQQRGFVNLSAGVMAQCPPPGDLAEAGIGIGAFLNARPHLFCRSTCGNYVKREPQPRAPPAILPQLAAQQQQADAEAPSCVVCLAMPKEGCFLPCMHKCCCMACGERVMAADARCPVCRAGAERFARVFE